MPKFSVDIGGRTVTGEVPEGTSQEDAIKQAQTWAAQNPYEGSAQWGDIPRGMAKGVLGLARTGGQMLGPGAKAELRSIPGEAALEQYQKTPSRSWLETGSQYVGAAAPFVAGEIATGGSLTPALGAVAGPIVEGLAWGGASSAAQPTEEGTVGSHLLHGIEGAATSIPFTGGSAIAKGIGKALAPKAGVWGPQYSKKFADVMERYGRHAAAVGQEAAIHAVGHEMGIPPYYVMPAWLAWNWLHHTPLSNTAARWARDIAPTVQNVGPYLQGAGRAVERTAPSMLGTGIGYAQEDQDGR